MRVLLSPSLLVAALTACSVPRTVEPEPAPVAAPAPAVAPRPLRPAVTPAGTPAAATVPRPSPAARGDDAALREKLATTRVGRVRFDADTGGFADVLRWLGIAADVPILTTPAARRAIADAGLRFEGELRAPIPAADLLDLLVAQSDALTWRVRRGVVEVRGRTDAPDPGQLVTHDVRDLVLARTEFLPPKIGGLPTGSGEPRSGGEAEETHPAIKPDLLVEQVKTLTDPAYWERDDAGTMEYLDSGYLLVQAPPAVQRRVARALAQLR